MCVIAYVSGHGLGHAAREIEILRRLPPDVPLVVKTKSPAWFWNEEMTRPFELVSAGFDVGAVQHSSLTTDIGETLAAWNDIRAQNVNRFADEFADAKRRGAQVIVGDIVPFAFAVADALGVPAFCPTNFTWADIYADYVPTEPHFAPIVAELAAQYSRATLLDTDLALPMPYFTMREHVGLVARTGTDRRNELLDALPPDERDKRLALLYAGNWGLPLAWERLADFASDWHFLMLQSPPADETATLLNLSILPRVVLPHPDIVASVDLVISKPGYGLVGECLAAGTPLLYCPRSGFAEYAAIDAALVRWPGGYKLPLDAFVALAWQQTLNSLPPRNTIESRPAPGGANAAARITSAWHTAARRTTL